MPNLYPGLTLDPSLHQRPLAPETADGSLSGQLGPPPSTATTVGGLSLATAVAAVTAPSAASVSSALDVSSAGIVTSISGSTVSALHQGPPPSAAAGGFGDSGPNNGLADMAAILGQAVKNEPEDLTGHRRDSNHDQDVAVHR